MANIPNNRQESTGWPTQDRKNDTFYPTYMTGTHAKPRTRTCLPIHVYQQQQTVLWDTGAELSIISGKVCKELGIDAEIQRSKAVATSVCHNNIHMG